MIVFQSLHYITPKVSISINAIYLFGLYYIIICIAASTRSLRGARTCWTAHSVRRKKVMAVVEGEGVHTLFRSISDLDVYFSTKSTY